MAERVPDGTMDADGVDGAAVDAPKDNDGDDSGDEADDDDVGNDSFLVWRMEWAAADAEYCSNPLNLALCCW